mgnify:CR=1 FL=1
MKQQSKKFYTWITFPKSRIATVDIGEIGGRKHHVAAILEADVTDARIRLKDLKRSGIRVSFNAWMVKVIAGTISEHKLVAAFLKGSRKAVVFDDVNISFLIEKEINGQRVPIPLLIPQANNLSVAEITGLLDESVNKTLSGNDILISRKPTFLEKLYYNLPGFLRRAIWKIMLKRPDYVFGKMGNAAITSIGMFGKINGWFIPITVHPVCIGLGSVIKKPLVVDDKIEIREVLNMTVLFDHDVIDGAPAARFIRDLVKGIEKGLFLE